VKEVGGGLDGAGRGGGGGFLVTIGGLTCCESENMYQVDWPATSATPFRVAPSDPTFRSDGSISALPAAGMGDADFAEVICA